ncbi:ABC transporter ATP-binding protein [Microbacterium sp. NPDC058389]|uniref:ABC transporter ATP-binding protein n=1 Tax=Microbacterium sp. NPDC058389 TaxID=3346475 RepID=UPI0036694CED
MTASTAFNTLSLRGVTRTYPKATAPALRSFDLDIERGEFVALLGPSGCGKSTALACLAGLQPLSDGSIWRDEQRIDTLPAERRGFGMVFQSYALFPHLSVRANVEFGLRMRGVPRVERRRRAIEMLDLVQLEQHADKLPAQLSGGQQQRVAIARALAIDPDFVLMDEPLSNLDAALRVGMRTEIKRLYQERGLTVLYVTHDQEEALSLATRIVVLRNGRIEQAGTPAEVHEQPASPYVAGFMGYRNLLDGALLGGNDSDVCVRVGELELTGVAAGAFDSGSGVVVAVRPADIRLGSSPSATGHGIAEVVEYHGRQRSVELRLADGSLLHVMTDLAVEQGSVVDFEFDPQRVLVYSSDAPEAVEPV